ncbi:MAG: transposase [Tepidanaerobacteraceae bacterium]|nr:transposase [Tepidanaerobacteraceae bacterium]
MPRVARQFSRTGFYHIMMRGINRESIFQSRETKKQMLDILAEKITNSDVGIYAYCVMDNHIHLLLKTEPEDLATFMKKVNGSFAMYYNREQKRIGPVFQDRYKSECVENEGYFWGVLKYIHLNPVKAYVVKNAEEYEWSSMKDYLSGKSELLDEEALVLKQENFNDNNSFLRMHENEDLRIYLDLKEELDEMKMTVSNRLIDRFLLEYGVTSVLELRQKEEALQSLLEQLTKEAKLTYQEIASLTNLSYSMVQRSVSKL